MRESRERGGIGPRERENGKTDDKEVEMKRDRQRTNSTPLSLSATATAINVVVIITTGLRPIVIHAVPPRSQFIISLIDRDYYY